MAEEGIPGTDEELQYDDAKDSPVLLGIGEQIVWHVPAVMEELGEVVKPVTTQASPLESAATA